MSFALGLGSHHLGSAVVLILGCRALLFLGHPGFAAARACARFRGSFLLLLVAGGCGLLLGLWWGSAGGAICVPSDWGNFWFMRGAWN